MAASPPPWSLSKAAVNGAVIGPFIILLNAYFGGQLATVGIADLAMMMLGGACGGAFLFLAIALVARFIARQRR
jgi:hypothetical protein